MPMFFFDLEQDGKVESDEVGTDLPDMQAARNEAIETLVEIAKDFLPSDGPRKVLAVIIRDKAGKQLHRSELAFAEEPTDWAH